ncbi:(E)-4-hydroxy-3-methylbut-2-enyl-diphosphate synthase [Pelagicoccus mobilis]|uniref:4-hydroxy-3-methylbut-2-en-1-yl diphosphate synthase (flavodoxin) n=1 Tax=Pelagicoccus mobilis TaxID=415221 RepID=A0A934VQR5_9BACT|nr:(E)-4-hydroxy-3-methylbut-2-enyl-diphosphate synthase [Pelagicoccus mobilis]MBK1876769.1 (E)-4-hydroxy-3-methylbut-2-enyl-diphosphate synthase [Pelagicoccus mobilis]
MSSYCSSRFATLRRVSREVKVGSVGVGGANPIRIQSMTTTLTQNVDDTVKQSIALAESGCEIVRVTAPNKKAAQALKDIRADFTAAGFGHIPLVADIHFLPSAAMEAVEHVEKVRVNPGNYADSKKFKILEYSDSQYDAELQRLHDDFSPLVKRAKELGRTLRIGTNHGSLSDRIMNRYGDTPLGMVESALEFLRIAQSHSYYDMILSMKASNPKVMIEAYRLLVEHMDKEDMHYPLHLGVTEAGDGEDGRIKSAIGIGSLLMDGLGDTIRVSLTEDPVYEIPVARALAQKIEKQWQVESDRRAERKSLITDTLDPHNPIPEDPQTPAPGTPTIDSIDPYHFERRQITTVQLSDSTKLGFEEPPTVITPVTHPISEYVTIAAEAKTSRPKLGDSKLEGILLKANTIADLEKLTELCEGIKGAAEFIVVELNPQLPLDEVSLALPHQPFPLAILRDFGDEDYNDYKQFVHLCSQFKIRPIIGVSPTVADGILSEPEANLIVTLHSRLPAPAPKHVIGQYRLLADRLKQWKNQAPLWIRNFPGAQTPEPGTFLSNLLDASILTGSLLCDGLGDMISVESDNDLVRSTRLAYNVLQGAGSRITKTEFVACPSCGRTLFDLQSTTQRIREKTGHLKGVKIAIMGCIVNGPGEMADADFGYVGGAPGKINLYVGKECVKYNIPQAEADERLIDLIRDHGKWVDPKPVAIS